MILEKQETKEKSLHTTAFTLVETLVAIAILLVAVVEPLSIVAGSVATANLAKDQVTAYFLAQEGVELVKNVRDSNVGGLPQQDWLSGLDGCLTVSGNQKYCTIDSTSLSINTCDTPTDPRSCTKFSRVKSGNLVSYDYPLSCAPPDCTETSFRRSITISEPVDNREAEIEVIMYWTAGGQLFGSLNASQRERMFKIKERILNWSGN